MVMFSYRIIIFLFSFVLANYSLPTRYNLEADMLRAQTPGWPSKGYVDLRSGSGGSFFVGTFNGLGKIDALPFNLSESLIEDNLYKITDSNLPEGGNPVVKTYPLDGGEVLIVVSGILTVPDPNNRCGDPPDSFCQKGTGIAWSTDSGVNWNYIDQSESASGVEYPCEIDQNVTCYEAEWNGIAYDHGVYRGLYDDYRVTNITWDVAADIDYEYIYAASWYGLLKRFKYTDSDPQWEPVPLPNDSDFSLSCDNFPPQENYYYGAAFDDIEGIIPTTYNHRPFSVEIIDGDIWVGGSGVNRGEILGESCINWTRHTANSTFQTFDHYDFALGSDWVVGIHAQKLEEGNRIWTINWVDPPAAHHLSYTEDNGQTWRREKYFSNLGSLKAIVYNLYSFDSTPNDGIDEHDILYASTEKGLFKFEGLNNWVKEEIATDEIFDEIGISNENSSSFSVRTAAVDQNNNLLVGTTDGLIVKDLLGQFYYPEYVDAILAGNNNNLLVYPNPFIVDDENHATFIVESSNNGKLEIYDFSMSKVANGECNYVDQTLECTWNGLSDRGDRVANGIYFCKLHTNERVYWEKLGVVRRK